MKTPDSTAFLYRQYMLENSFELYYYKDYPSKGVSIHTHNFYEFYFFLEGNLEITMDGNVHRIRPGSVPSSHPECPTARPLLMPVYPTAGLFYGCIKIIIRNISPRRKIWITSLCTAAKSCGTLYYTLKM